MGLERAIKNYKMWHARHADLIARGKQAFPSRVAVAGHLDEVMYCSDKWTGKWTDYIHECESHAAVWVGFDDGKTDAEKLLGITDWKRLHLTELAVFIELTHTRVDGKKENVDLDGSILACTEDCRTLVVLREDGELPIMMRGGKMRCTADGIVW